MLETPTKFFINLCYLFFFLVQLLCLCLCFYFEMTQSFVALDPTTKTWNFSLDDYRQLSMPTNCQKQGFFIVLSKLKGIISTVCIFLIILQWRKQLPLPQCL